MTFDPLKYLALAYSALPDTVTCNGVTVQGLLENVTQEVFSENGTVTNVTKSQIRYLDGSIPLVKGSQITINGIAHTVTHPPTREGYRDGVALVRRDG